MNIAIIIAGGIGQRFGSNIPKQFIQVNNQPIILYTLRIFQNASSIDKIVIVCVDGWQEFVYKLTSDYKLRKVVAVIKGGKSRFDSVYEGIKFCKKNYNDNDILIIHDSVRPCITEALISDSIKKAQEYGAALATDICYDTMFVSEDGKQVDFVYPRNKLFKGQTPESVRLELASKYYEKAISGNLKIDSPTELFMWAGHKVGFSLGNKLNIKITTKEDICIFKSIVGNYIKE
ncbi:MAG: 2-C-methyl-D-erythritol 4-phosphate cytidylyltransferase [Acidaminococcaceae bacterium]|nr:2-C-methyl-D-erythritol 4-phosphate cytidylyltransferase [Acidaminococcaceae bacterium]